VESQTALLLLGATDLAVAGAFAYVGLAFARRPQSGEGRLAARLFRVWWFGIALAGVGAALASMLASRDADPRHLDAVNLASLAAYAAALVGFVTYLDYLYRGSHRLLVPVAAGFAALVAWSVVDGLANPATGYALTAWRPVPIRAASFGPPPALTAALLLIPTLASVVAYASLLRRAPAAACARIRLVSLSLALWLAGAGVTSFPGLGDRLDVQALGRGLIVLAAFGVLRAYGSAPPRASAEARRDRLAARVAELI
jgi:hypothetical protein